MLAHGSRQLASWLIFDVRRNPAFRIMKKLLTSLIVVVALALMSACDATRTLTQGFAQGKAVGDELKEKFGSAPFVGFNWRNGFLLSVTVNFSEYPAGKTFSEISNQTRVLIKKHFSQEPKQIVLSFAIKP